MTSCGSRNRGLSVFCIRPRRIASGSSSPKLPVDSARRCSFSFSAPSSSGLEVGAISERSADMGASVRTRLGARVQLAQEQAIDGVARLVGVRICQRIEELGERGVVVGWYLDAHQDAPVVRTLVAVME